MAYEKSPTERQLAEALTTLEENRTGIVLSGRIVNGQIELDAATQDELKRKFANATKSFVAVNAPFDPRSSDTADDPRVSS